MQTADFYSSATGTLRVNGGRDKNAPQGVSLSIDDLSYIKQGSRANDAEPATDYDLLDNKPQINNITLTGNKSLNDLGIQPKIDSSHKVSADNIDDTETTNKFATAAQLSQIETNKNNISKQQDTVASGGNGYAIINGKRIYMTDTQPTTQRLGDVWISDKLYVYSGFVADNPLCAIGSNIDTLNLSSGLCTRYVRKIVLDGTENWFLQSINEHGIVNLNTDYDFLTGISSDRSAINSHFYQTTAPIAEITEPCFSISPSSSTLYLKVLSSVASTPAEIKTWLAAQYAAGTPVTLWYILDAATTETITVPAGLTGTESGYLIQDGTPTPTAPIYPTANSVIIWH